MEEEDEEEVSFTKVWEVKFSGRAEVVEEDSAGVETAVADSKVAEMNAD